MVVLSALLVLAGNTRAKRNAIIEIPPDSPRIVITAPTQPPAQAAARELQLHLGLILGKEPPLSDDSGAAPDGYPFWIGRCPVDDDTPPAAEEGRWAITPDGAYFYGDDRGCFHAVLDFLETQLGVRWIKPGDIAFTPQSPLHLALGRGGWAPAFRERYLWPLWTGEALATCREAQEFEWPEADRQARAADTRAWLARQRANRFISWDTRHAFTEWWARYGAEHPEYFALTAAGRRAPTTGALDADNAAARATRQDTQLCVNNPEVIEQILASVRARAARPFNINIANNDSFNTWCRCPGCRALDVLAPTGSCPVLTDRYLDFANRTAREARRMAPDLKVHTLAYNETATPPLRERLDPNLLITYVPTDFRLEKLQAELDGWIRAGAQVLRFRPNLHHYWFCGGLPLGCEQHLYDMIRLVAAYPQVVGFNFDALMHQWALTGFSDYVLTKTISDPSRSFDYWEAHYLAAFGAGAPDVRAYFRHYRRIWAERILPDYEAILERGRSFNLARGIAMAPGTYYTEADFDATDGHLVQALARGLNPAEQARVRDLQLANEQARHIVRIGTAASGTLRTEAVRALLEFRRAHRDWRGAVLPWLVCREGRWGDLTGMRLAAAQADYDLPILDTPLFWRFRPDPEEVGIREEWFRISPGGLKDWDLMATHIYWETAKSTRLPYPSDELKEQMADYDGLAWYAQVLAVPPEWRDRQVFVFFGAVDESCRVYANGRLAGERRYQQSGDESTPFAVDITSQMDWTRPGQTRVAVQVEDRSGAGGIWRQVFLVSRQRMPATDTQLERP